MKFKENKLYGVQQKEFLLILEKRYYNLIKKKLSKN
jgi:hypothetical protein